MISGPTPGSSLNHCRHCGRACHAIWRFFDFDHHDVRLYESCCAECAREQDRTFTAELAIDEAQWIVVQAHATLNTAVRQ